MFDGIDREISTYNKNTMDYSPTAKLLIFTCSVNGPSEGSNRQKYQTLGLLGE